MDTESLALDPDVECTGIMRWAFLQCRAVMEASGVLIDDLRVAMELVQVVKLEGFKKLLFGIETKQFEKVTHLEGPL